LWAYTGIAVVYALIVIFFFTSTPRVVIARRRYLLLFYLFASIVFARTVLAPTIPDAIRLISLLTFTTANLFVIPRVISFRNFCIVITRLSVVLILIGFLPFLGIHLWIPFIDLSLWGSQLYWYPSLPPITSVFVNPNQLGALALVGSITALGEYWERGMRTSSLFLAINFVGLLFTNYRTGWAAFVAALGLFVVYSLWGRKTLVMAAVCGLSTITVLLLMVFNVIPGPAFLAELSLNGRRELWTESYYAFRAYPIWGLNFQGVSEIVGNPHNSFLRMFIGFGVFGGVLYITLTAGTVIGSARVARTPYRVILVMVLTALCIIQIFNQLSFVGISMRSSLIAIMMGYYISGAQKFSIQRD